VLDRRQALVLEEDHLVLQQGRLDVGELLLIQRDREVDVLDKGADGRRQRAGADPGHVVQSRRASRRRQADSRPPPPAGGDS
jgi:hypothetical protein